LGKADPNQKLKGVERWERRRYSRLTLSSLGNPQASKFNSREVKEGVENAKQRKSKAEAKQKRSKRREKEWVVPLQSKAVVTDWE